MKVLFVFYSPEYIRNYKTTISELNRAGHVVFLSSVDDNRGNTIKRSRLDPTAWGFLNAHNIGPVPYARGALFRIKRLLRSTVDFMRFLHPDYAGARSLRQRMKEKALNRRLRFLDRFSTFPPGLLHRLVVALCWLDSALPVDKRVRDFLCNHDPDLVVVTPLVTPASIQTDIVNAAKSISMPVAVCIASWDNLTNKGLIKAKPDKVFVWNEDQRQEAIRYHYIPRTHVDITGAPLFDHWFSTSASASYEAYCRTVSLRADRPYILYVGSSSFIAPNADEIRFVHRWIRALRTSRYESLRHSGILIRPHPYNYGIWESIDLEMLDNVSIWPTTSPVLASDENQNDLYHSIFHSSAVVGINTSVMIEAAIIGRRVFTIEADEFSRGQGETLHFNYLLSDRGGVASMAQSLAEHCEQLVRVLDGEPEAPDYSAFVERFIRPAGKEQPAAQILAAKLAKLVPESAETWKPFKQIAVPACRRIRLDETQI